MSSDTPVNQGYDKAATGVVHKIQTKGLKKDVVLCRCWKSSTFPYSDGCCEEEHNKDTGDNVGGLVIRCEASGNSATNKRVIRPQSTMPKEVDPKHVNHCIDKQCAQVVDTVHIPDLEDLANGEGHIAMCRCWRSTQFPYCDGAHRAHNAATGDNATPVLLLLDHPKPVQPVQPVAKPKRRAKVAFKPKWITFPDDPKGAMIPFSEVAKHNTKTDQWLIIHGRVYDLSTFKHPGGQPVVNAVAGRDATRFFEAYHNMDIIINTLGTEGQRKLFKGMVDPETLPKSAPQKKEAPRAVPPVKLDELERPPLAAVLNLHDFAAIAERTLKKQGKKQAWDYYSSGSGDEVSYGDNEQVWNRIWLRPKVLVDVANVDMTTTMLGTPVSFPVYLSAVAMCGLGHEEGELAWVRGAGEEGVVYMAPSHSSKGLVPIAEEGLPDQVMWFQLYVHPDRQVVKKAITDAQNAGFKALCITCDSAVPGRRERDLRNKVAFSIAEAEASGEETGRKAGQYATRDAGLNWDDLPWFQEQTTMDIVLKGIARGDDAVRAAKSGVKAIVLSNHGGRNLDSSRSGLEILPEVMTALAAAGLKDAIEVYIDGGIRRGTDILKALALGAKGVGLGKPAVFSMSAYGTQGVVRMLQLLKEEFRVSMKLAGCRTIKDITPALITRARLSSHALQSTLPASPYKLPLDTQAQRERISQVVYLLLERVAELEHQLGEKETELAHARSK